MDNDMTVGSQCPLPIARNGSSAAGGDSLPHSFQFVVTTAARKPSAKDKKAIRSHVAKGKGRPKQSSAVQKPLARSWIQRSPNDKSLGFARQTRTGQGHSLGYPSPYIDSTLSPPNSDTSSQTEDADPEAQLATAFVMRSLSFVPGMDAPTLTKIFDSFSTMQAAMHPPGICHIHDIFDSVWLKFMIQDLLFSTIAQFIAEAVPDWKYNRPINSKASKLFYRVLQQLRTAIENPKTATCDSTIGVILMLIMAADIAGDISGAMKHLQGLIMILGLRGGVRKLPSAQLQIKICRADLQLAMITGVKPQLWKDTLVWESFFTSPKKPRKVYSERLDVHFNALHFFLDPRLEIVWRDTQELCAIVNLSALTNQKLEPNLYQEILISVQYRLLDLDYVGSSFSPDICGSHQNRVLHESIRLAILGLTSTMFLYVGDMEKRYSYLVANLEMSLLELEEPFDKKDWELRVWLLFMTSTLLADAGSREWFRTVMRQGLAVLGIRSWEGAKKHLKRYMWIDLIHGEHGKGVFDQCQTYP